MAGFVVGSLILTWILCSALNASVEYAAIRGWLNRGTAFLSMVVGVLLIGGGMVALAVWGFAGSAIAAAAVNPHQVESAIRTGCVIDVLFALGYCAFQLRRFWED